MDKKMIVVLVGVFIGALMLGISLAPKKTTAPEEPIADSGMVVMEVVATHDDTDRLYRIDVEYPQFKGAAQGVNDPIATYVNEGIADFKTIVRENWKAQRDTMPAGQIQEEYPASPFTFSVTWEPKQINATYISLLVRVDAYEGGANARRELKTFNYDVAKGAEIGLQDLFPNDKAYLGKVSKFAYGRLIEDLKASSRDDVNVNMVAEGTAPIQDNFKNFTFDDAVIDLYFPKYQVAPGVFGEQHVTMWRKNI